MHVAFLYTESALTPWKENVNEDTLLFLTRHSPTHIRPAIVEFGGFNDGQLHRLRKFDLVFNLCYGYKDAGQVEVADWLTRNNIAHTASSPMSMRMAQDKGLLPAELGLLTPPIVKMPEGLPAICENAGIPVSELISRTISNTLLNSKRAGVVPSAVGASSV